jgi:hypothetical protein
MKSDTEIISKEIPEQSFFSLRELGNLGPFSSEYWSKIIREGRVRVVQRSARTQGSRILVPRNEVIRFLAEECVR